MDKYELGDKLEDFQQALKQFQKDNKYHKLNRSIEKVQRPLLMFSKKFQIPGKTRFNIVSDGKAKVEQVSRSLPPEPEQDSKILANNAETPDAKKEQVKKRRRSRKKKEE